MAKSVNRDQQEHLVLGYLLKVRPESATEKEIADATGVNPGDVSSLLEISIKAGLAVKDGKRYRFIAAV